MHTKPSEPCPPLPPTPHLLTPLLPRLMFNFVGILFCFGRQAEAGSQGKRGGGLSLVEYHSATSQEPLLSLKSNHDVFGSLRSTSWKHLTVVFQKQTKGLRNGHLSGALPSSKVFSPPFWDLSNSLRDGNDLHSRRSHPLQNLLSYQYP